jgi:hypothetical protein
VDELNGPGIKDRVLHVAPCRKLTGAGKKNRDCMLILTNVRLIFSPLPESTMQDRPKQKRNNWWPLRISGSGEVGSSWTLADQYMMSDPAEILADVKAAREILYENITSITLTRIRRSRHHPLLFPFTVGIPENARYHVDYQLAVKSGETVDTVLTPFSLGIKQALVDVLGSRVREEIDDHAPFL